MPNGDYSSSFSLELCFNVLPCKLRRVFIILWIGESVMKNFSFFICYVFRPAFGCCAHPKAGQTTTFPKKVIFNTSNGCLGQSASRQTSWCSLTDMLPDRHGAYFLTVFDWFYSKMLLNYTLTHDIAQETYSSGQAFFQIPECTFVQQNIDT